MGLNPNQKLKDAFNGSLSKILDKNIDFLIQDSIFYVQSLKDDVKTTVIHSLPYGTKWFLENKVEQIVEKIFNTTVPDFLWEKRDELKYIIEKFLNYKISDLGIDANSVNRQKIKYFLLKIFETNTFKSETESLSKIFVESLLEMKLEDILKILNIRNFRQFIEIIFPVLEDGIILIQSNLAKNQNELKIFSKNLLETVLKDILKDKKISILFKNVDIKKETKTFLTLFKEKENEVIYVIENILNFLLNNKFYSKEFLVKDLNNFIKDSLIKDRAMLKEKLNLFFKEIIFNTNNILDYKFKQYILESLSEAIFNALENHIEEIIKSIDIKKVIIKEIENMHPQEIEDMFNSFAGNYFKKLKLYGVGGAFFGIPSMFI